MIKIESKSFYDTHATDVTARHNTRSTDEGSTNVRHNGTVQVGHDHDVELCRASNELHGPISINPRQRQKHVKVERKRGIRVVNDHVVVFDTGRLVFLRYPTEGVKEETVTEFHDVRLVHARDFLQSAWRTTEHIPG